MRSKRTLTEACTFLCSAINHIGHITRTNEAVSVQVFQTKYSSDLRDTLQKAENSVYSTAQNVIIYQDFSLWTSALINKLKTAAHVHRSFGKTVCRIVSTSGKRCVQFKS